MINVLHGHTLKVLMKTPLTLHHQKGFGHFYHMWENFGVEKMGNMASCGLFTNILLASKKYKTIVVLKYALLTINLLITFTLSQTCSQQTLHLLWSCPSTKLIHQGDKIQCISKQIAQKMVNLSQRVQLQLSGYVFCYVPPKVFILVNNLFNQLFANILPVHWLVYLSKFHLYGN